MPKVGWILSVVLFVLGTLSATQGFLNAVEPSGSPDFHWSVSRQLLNHENPYRLYVEHRPLVLERPRIVPAYPASGEIFLWPLAALNFDHAKRLWAAANIAFAIGSVVLIARMTAVSGVVVLAMLGLFLASTPVRNTIGNGQQGLFSFFFFLLAVDQQRQERTPLAALCLAASWLKYTVSLPLSLIFLRRGWRTTFAIASAVHIGLTLFLAFWTGESALDLLLGSIIAAGDTVGHAVTPHRFDVIAIARHLGVSSLMGPGSVGIALFIVVAGLLFKSINDLTFDLSLLSLVSLIWAYHRQYDYFVLIIPLFYALKHWQQKTIDAADILIVFSTFLVWYVQRILDGVVAWSSENISFSLASDVIFWLSCLTFYAAFISYFTNAFVRQRPVPQEM
jgi:hypothetical protein